MRKNMASLNEEKESAEDRWINYRPEIKVLDCTVRDGGLMKDLFPITVW
jgi:hypothetical protein